MIAILFTTSHSAFVHSSNEYMLKVAGKMNAFAAVLDTAKTHGYTAAPFDWKTTLMIFVWPFVGMCACFVSAYFGGEIRNARRAQWIAIPGSLLFSAVLMILLLLGSAKVVGTANSRSTFIITNGIGLSFTPISANSDHNVRATGVVHHGGCHALDVCLGSGQYSYNYAQSVGLVHG